MPQNETHLGDGAYASFDGFTYTLRAPREHGDDFVMLEPEVLMSFLRLVKETTPGVFDRV